MGIYIKGMQMPITCGSCWFCHAVKDWHCRLTGKSFESYSVGWGNENNTGENGQHPYIRRDDCPFVEVPEPHGRLIDASEEITVQMYDDQHEDFYQVKMTIDDLLSQSWIDAKAPTVIPAEEEQ